MTESENKECTYMYLNDLLNRDSRTVFNWRKIECFKKRKIVTLICERQLVDYSTGETLVVSADQMNLFFPLHSSSCHSSQKGSYSTISERINSRPTSIDPHVLLKVQFGLSHVLDNGENVTFTTVPLCFNSIHAIAGKSTITENVIAAELDRLKGTGCHIGYIACPSGTCIADHLLLDGRRDCNEDFDEDITMVAAHFAGLRKFNYFFDCGGDAVKWHQVCDGIIDCSNGTDEHQCNAEVSTWTSPRVAIIEDPDRWPAANQTINTSHTNLFHCAQNNVYIPISWVNDLYPDCPHSEDEPLLERKFPYKPSRPMHCEDPTYLPCYAGHHACYPPSDRCQYDVDRYHHLSVCRNGGHLFGCMDYNCTGKFKCPGSYCIPLKRLCDGVADCPYAEDETSCPRQLECPGLLRCGASRCVSIGDISNAVYDCPNGDDEPKVKAGKCPGHCVCVWRTITCNDTTANADLLEYFKHVTLRLKERHELPSFTGGRYVIVLNASHGSLKRLQKNQFKNITNVASIDFSHSYLTNIAANTFSKLTNLRFINLAWNKIEVIHADAFYQLDKLSLINISNNKLASIRERWFRNVYDSINIDLSVNEISVIYFSRLALFPANSNITLSGNRLMEIHGYRAIPMMLSGLDGSLVYLCCLSDEYDCEGKLYCLCPVYLSQVETYLNTLFVTVIFILNIVAIVMRRRKTKKIVISAALNNINGAGILLCGHSLILDLRHIFHQTHIVPSPLGIEHILCIIAAFWQYMAVFVTNPLFAVQMYALKLSTAFSMGSENQAKVFITIITTFWLLPLLAIIVKIVAESSTSVTTYPDLQYMCSILQSHINFDTGTIYLLCALIIVPIISLAISIALYFNIRQVLLESVKAFQSSESRVVSKADTMAKVQGQMNKMLIFPIVAAIPVINIVSISIANYELNTVSLHVYDKWILPLTSVPAPVYFLMKLAKNAQAKKKI